jgi:hypothetical protein
MGRPYDPVLDGETAGAVVWSHIRRRVLRARRLFSG